MDPLTLTEEAAAQIEGFTNEETIGLRIAIAGGGCSGFQYEFELATELEEDDNVFESHGVKLIVDPLSFQYLAGSELDFKQEIMGSRFELNNPNAVGACGCGESVRF